MFDFVKRVKHKKGISMATKRIYQTDPYAAENEAVTAEVYDITHFPKLREKYNVMSVPCLVVNDGEAVSF